MWIKVVKLNNWRAFAGEHVIELSDNKNRPITIFHAENEVGKTCLLSAIRWALHEETPDGVSDSLQHSSHKDDPAKVELIVESDWEGEPYDYLISREIDKNGNIDFSVQVNRGSSSGYETPSLGAKEVVQNILPKELGEIFLFTGENITQAIDEKKSLENSIHRVAGITNSKFLKDFLEKFEDKLKGEKSKYEKKNINSQTNKNHLEGLEKTESDLKEQILDLNGHISILEERNKEIDILLDEIGAEKIKKANEDLKKFEANLKRGLTELQEIKIKKNDLIEEKGYWILIKNLSLPTIQSASKNEKPFDLPIDPEPAMKTFLDNVKKHDLCICGRKVNHDEECLKSIEDWYFDSKNLGDITSEYKDIQTKLNNHKQDYKSYLKILNDSNYKIKNKEHDIKNLEDLIDKANLSIQGSSQEDIAELGKERQENVDNIKKAIRIKDGDDATLGKQEQLVKIQLLINSAKKKSTNIYDEEIKKIEKKVGFVSSQINALNTIQEQLELDSKEFVKKEINSLCESYSKSATRFDFKEDSFTPQFLSGNNQEEDDPSGAKKILNSIYIGLSLIKLADSRKGKKDVVIDPGASAAWVCDAPFANMDPVNLKTSAKIVLGYEKQLIIFINSGQYNDAFKDQMDPKKVGKRWLMKRHLVGNIGSDKDVTTKIIIEGKKYETVEKSKENYNYTSFKKI